MSKIPDCFRTEIRISSDTKQKRSRHHRRLRSFSYSIHDWIKNYERRQQSQQLTTEENVSESVSCAHSIAHIWCIKMLQSIITHKRTPVVVVIEPAVLFVCVSRRYLQEFELASVVGYVLIVVSSSSLQPWRGALHMTLHGNDSFSSCNGYFIGCGKT